MGEKNNDVEMPIFLHLLELLNLFYTSRLQGLIATFHSQKISQSELRLKNESYDKYAKTSGCWQLIKMAACVERSVLKERLHCRILI